MINSLLTRVFGSRNERQLRQLHRIVAKVNALEPEMEQLSDAQLQAKTPELRGRVASGESLDKVLPEAFAVCREASRRVLGMRHYDVQLIGGMVLHLGKIAEMRTGEGKTLVATLPVYLNALEDKGVHVVTVNDYLARRDAAQMGKLYNWLGLSVGVVYPGMPHSDKHAAYAADITYGTNNEFGFDYLRDNMALSKADRYQRGLNYAIVDEVDSILIDEARTPLIISGPADDSPELYIRVNRIVPQLTKQESEEGEGDFWVDEKGKQVHLSEAGMEHAEELLRAAGILTNDEDRLYGAQNLSVVHHLNAALRAHAIYQRDVDYIVRDGEVVIVDEFTGRTLPGRRWSDGLHQAVEAKEGVPVQRENQTLASITFQNLFRMYKKLSGMTGTADTEAYEFQSIYNLEVVVIPTNRPTIRKDWPDQVFLNRQGKFNAVLADIEDCAKRGQPVLVGTTSIETSEMLSEHLRKAGVKHEVLNAKQHEREAQIVANAGQPGAVTIATNMAGRGTDIVLGGSLEAELHALGEEDLSEAERARLKAAWQERHDAVKAAGGLHIIGTERHESRRIDNQLRGRSGRQGDPGSSRFYLSLEDNLMRIFASDWVQKAMRMMGMKEDDVIEDKLVSRQIEKAQRKVEAHNFDIRKNLLDFDDVNNDQRKVIYAQRDELLDAESVKDNVDGIRDDVIYDIVARFVPPNSIDEQWDLAGLEATLSSDLGLPLSLTDLVKRHEELDAAGIAEKVCEEVDRHFQEKEAAVGGETMRALEKHVMLTVLDQSWKEHLARMDYLRQGIHLRGYAQKQPKQEYKKEAFELFSEMLEHAKREVVTLLARVRIRSEEEVAALEAQERQQMEAQLRQAQFQHQDVGGYSADEEAEQLALGANPKQVAQVTREAPKVGRNDPCPCGSGKKYKHCHGQLS
ncbi:preprotein translocase subunit SecA [Xanthomonas graminis]|jgi:preprotein translocase subunit SecA|uniref:Protein translocase subunit SecA n=1 Tax=Xanthomonas graminis pv. graminis TaxID=134874 RepID=A0A1M4J4U5_9XANT|nr:preprotein translocase subunit SecA [Xanthomonas translucens]EKU26434.1 Preprotein translocase subunit SecA [Xanthomonas translucens pv. graminis ART-Xtg29]OAX62652.1 preprotein translocase subunit SecA [Xanthomonas translucens pv. graminis]UKE53869.1 preprotein translocase subunit SecA [Xanthomonas translucens pv. graminis]WIH08186.1 preprotein translocase subunit SecA [Xanthomonas translucens pv. graminis]WIH13061.1 preprotein translocase subunit SecA [Xanthomonas translucens pv. graminis